MIERKTRREATDFILYMKMVIKKLKADKKHPAVHTYTATMNSITQHSEEKGNAMTIAEVYTRGGLKEYQEWLRHRKASWNTVSTYMRTLKAVYNRLLDDKLVEYEPKLFEDVYTKVESQAKRSLTQEQAKVLMTADFSALPDDVQRVLAYCLLMFLFRGMPFIDLAYLRKQDMKGNSIVYCRHKTGRQMTVRIPHEALVLIEEYCNKNPESGYLFPILDGQIKDEGEVYQYYLRALAKFNRKLGKLSNILLNSVKISSYTPRHTWATLAFYQGIPTGIISKALGHSSIKVTEAYLRPFENEKVDMANDKLILSVTKKAGEKDAA